MSKIGNFPRVFTNRQEHLNSLLASLSKDEQFEIKKWISEQRVSLPDVGPYPHDRAEEITEHLFEGSGKNSLHYAIQQVYRGEIDILQLGYFLQTAGENINELLYEQAKEDALVLAAEAEERDEHEEGIPA